VLEGLLVDDFPNLFPGCVTVTLTYQESYEYILNDKSQRILVRQPDARFGLLAIVSASVGVCAVNVAQGLLPGGRVGRLTDSRFKTEFCRDDRNSRKVVASEMRRENVINLRFNGLWVARASLGRFSSGNTSRGGHDCDGKCPS
jgi:hypothetical protein